jgi:hypothetical protein
MSYISTTYYGTLTVRIMDRHVHNIIIIISLFITSRKPNEYISYIPTTHQSKNNRQTCTKHHYHPILVHHVQKTYA